MNKPHEFSDDEIDALVLRHLEHEAESLDPRPLLGRIHASIASPSLAIAPRHTEHAAVPTVPHRHQAIWRVVAYGVSAVAAAVLIMFALQSTGEVNASAVVRQALDIHSLPIDRCYHVEVQRQDYEGADLVPISRVDRLWTRGDQFFLESTNTEHRWAWGRDQAGVVWSTYGRRAGLKLEPGEIPAWLDTTCEILSMQVETLLSEALREFTLTWDHAHSTDGLVVVDAVGIAGRRHKWLQDARLEIDAETKVLRKVVVHRWDRERRLVTVTYTLVGIEAQPEGSYQLEGRLEAPAIVYSRTNKPEKRIEILTKLYGPQLVRHWPGLNARPATTPTTP